MNRPLIVAIVGAFVVLAALGLTWLVGVREGLPDAPPPVTAEAPVPQGPEAGADLKTAPASTPEPEPQPKEAARDVGPSFDVVRVDREGNMVMAGRATPEAEVVIRDGERELGRVKADERGEWVFLPAEPLAPGTRELSLAAVGPEGEERRAKGSVVLVVPEPGAGDDRPALAVETAPGRPSRVLQAPAPALAEAGGGEAPIGAPGGTGAAPAVVIDVVDYDADGNLSFGGRAAPGAVVLAYIDNRFIGRVVAGPDGRWSVTAETPVSTGRHTLRADVLDAEAEDVAARAEIPFLRPESVDVPGGDGTRVVVQPGNSLWRIARDALGAGAAYTVIYEANRTQIRDPNLIYPGQVFVIPGEDGRVLER